MNRQVKIVVNRFNIRQNADATKNAANQSEIKKNYQYHHQIIEWNTQISTNSDKISSRKVKIYIIDSNREVINFEELLLTDRETNETTPIVIPRGNLKRVENILTHHSYRVTLNSSTFRN